MADGNDNPAGDNNAYRRMLEKQLEGRSLDELLAGNEERPLTLTKYLSNLKSKRNGLVKTPIKTDLTNKLIYTPLSKVEKVFPELPSEFEMVLLFSPAFDDFDYSWKPYGQGAIIRLKDKLYACCEENNLTNIFRGLFKGYIGYGRGALIGAEKNLEYLNIDDSARICPLPPAEPFHINFPNNDSVFPLGELAKWNTYAEGIIGLIGYFFSSRCTLVKYSDKKTKATLVKIPYSSKDLKILPSGEGAVISKRMQFMLYQEAGKEAIELYRGRWDDVSSWGDDMIIRTGREITRYSAGKESKLLYRGEGKLWKMTGCGILVGQEDGLINLRTDAGECFSFKGNMEKIEGYPLGMLVEDEAKRLWAIRRRRD